MIRELSFRLFTSILLIIILFFSYLNNEFFYILISLLFTLSIIEYSKLIIKIKKFYKSRFYLILFAATYLVSAFLLIFINLNEIKNIIFYFIIVCISTDVGGLIFGRIFKGKKLTKISPKKTYAGFYGSFLASFIAMIITYNYLDLNFFTITIFTFSLCLLSQLGDLFFSYLKRKAKVKDTGKILPGHGGILDRIDGIIISVPINTLIYTFTIWIGLQF